MTHLYESIDFDDSATLPRGWEEGVFRYCTFTGLTVEGQALSGILVDCQVKRCDWYWGLFNIGTFVRIEFRNCVFRGSAFAGCVFTQCKFVDCKFTEDSLGGSCRFDDCAWYGCEQQDCDGLPQIG